MDTTPMGKYIAAALVALCMSAMGFTGVDGFVSTNGWPSEDHPYHGQYQAHAAAWATGERLAALGIDGGDTISLKNTMSIFFTVSVSNLVVQVATNMTAYRQYELLLDIKDLLRDTIITNYCDHTVTNYLSDGFSDWLDNHTNNLPMWSVADLLDEVGAPTNYLDTSTPYELNAATNGWKWLPSIFSNLVCTPYIPTWTNSEECIYAETNTVFAAASNRTDSCLNVNLLGVGTDGYKWWDNVQCGVGWIEDPTVCPWTGYTFPSYSIPEGSPSCGSIGNTAPSLYAEINTDVILAEQALYEAVGSPGCYESLLVWHYWDVSYEETHTDNEMELAQTNITAESREVLHDDAYIAETCERKTQWYILAPAYLTNLSPHANVQAGDWWLFDESPEDTDLVHVSDAVDLAAFMDAISLGIDYACDNTETLGVCGSYTVWENGCSNGCTADATATGTWHTITVTSLCYSVTNICGDYEEVYESPIDTNYYGFTCMGTNGTNSIATNSWDVFENQCDDSWTLPTIVYETNYTITVTNEYSFTNVYNTPPGDPGPPASECCDYARVYKPYSADPRTSTYYYVTYDADWCIDPIAPNTNTYDVLCTNIWNGTDYVQYDATITGSGNDTNLTTDVRAVNWWNGTNGFKW